MTPHEQASIKWLKSIEGQKVLKDFPVRGLDSSGYPPDGPRGWYMNVEPIGARTALAIISQAWEERLREKSPFSINYKAKNPLVTNLEWMVVVDVGGEVLAFHAPTKIEALAKALEAVEG